MARPNERYEPGELQRTRKNLGDLDPSEAREIADRLGGEVGIEKTPDAIEDEYERLRQKAAEKTSSDSSRRSSRFVPASPSYQVSRRSNSAQQNLPRMGWRDRVRTDFYCARPEIRIKTLGQAFSSLGALFRIVPDTINPQFLIESDRHLFRDIESLVVAVRGLSSKNYKNAHQNLRRIPLYNQVIHVLRDWDIEAINRELTILQREPRGRGFADLAPLIRHLLQPLFKLSRLNPHVHVLPAITKMYELSRLYIVAKSERERLTTFYMVARESLPLVMNGLRVKLHPILLKLVANHFVDADAFYLEYAKELLGLVSLTEADLISEAQEREIPALPVANEAQSEPSVNVARPSRLASQGFLILEQLFPRAGWSDLESLPDLYAYFQTVFDYPKGSELIPIDDPLQVIQPLSEILQQLFFGFQSVQWGTIKNAAGETSGIQEQIEKKIARWHFFIAEIIGKNYLGQLQDYCREIERAASPTAEKRRREHQLLWVKRNYILPHLEVPVLDDVRFQSLGYPSLALQVKEMIELLAPVAAEIEQKPKVRTRCLNPDAKARFPVETPISLRFQAAMRRVLRPESGDLHQIDLATNRGLLFCVLACLSALDYLLSVPNNLLYIRQQEYLYRTSGLPRDEKPVYNVPLKATDLLLKKLNELQPPEASDDEWTNRLSELYGIFLAQEEIKKRIVSFHSDQIPFSLLALRLIDGDEATFEGLLRTIRAPQQSLSPVDGGRYLLILPGLVSFETENLARRLLVTAAETQPPLSVAAFVLPFQKVWTLEKFLSLPDKGWALAREIPPQILGIWSPNSQTFEFRSDVPATHTLHPYEP